MPLLRVNQSKVIDALVKDGVVRDFVLDSLGFRMDIDYTDGHFNIRMSLLDKSTEQSEKIDDETSPDAVSDKLEAAIQRAITAVKP
jgi:hypothetical protein